MQSKHHLSPAPLYEDIEILAVKYEVNENVAYGMVKINNKWGSLSVSL